MVKKNTEANWQWLFPHVWHFLAVRAVTVWSNFPIAKIVLGNLGSFKI